MHTLTFSWAESWHNAVLVTHQADFHLLLISNCEEWRMHSTPGEYKWLKTLVTTNGSPTCAHTKFFTQLFGKSPIEWYTTKRFFMTIFQCWGFHTGYVDNEFGFFPQTTLLQVFVPVFQLSILSGYCNWFLLAPLGVSEMLRTVYDIPCTNVTARVRRTLYKCYGPCTTYPVRTLPSSDQRILSPSTDLQTPDISNDSLKSDFLCRTSSQNFQLEIQIFYI